MKRVMIRLVRLYQKYISPLKRPTCRFTPTCSAYAIEAFEKRGFFAGFILTVWRILRCNPFCKGGYDPVPDKGFRRVTNAAGEIITHTDSENGAGSDIEAANFAADPNTAVDGEDIIEASAEQKPATRHKEKEK